MADMTSRSNGLGFSDHLSSPVKAKVECCKLCDLFGCWVIDCSATRTLSSSITGCHPWPTGSLIWCACVGGSGYSTAPDKMTAITVGSHFSPHQGKCSTTLLYKLLTLVKDILPEVQCGFHTNRGTTDMILRQMQEKYIEQDIPLCMILTSQNPWTLWTSMYDGTSYINSGTLTTLSSSYLPCIQERKHQSA